MCSKPSCTCDHDVPEMTRERRALLDIGRLGYFLHTHVGGLAGKPHVLICLLKNNHHLTQRQLQEKISCKPATLSEVLSKLEAAHLITRVPLSEDRRQLDISLTEEGVVEAESLQAHRLTFETSCLGPLTAAEQEQLIDMLDKLVDHWDSFDTKDRRNQSSAQQSERRS